MKFDFCSVPHLKELHFYNATQPTQGREYRFVNYEEFSHSVIYGQLDLKEGYIEIPKSPGLGIDLNENALSDYPYLPFPQRKIRDSRDEGP